MVIVEQVFVYQEWSWSGGLFGPMSSSIQFLGLKIRGGAQMLAFAASLRMNIWDNLFSPSPKFRMNSFRAQALDATS